MKTDAMPLSFELAQTFQTFGDFLKKLKHISVLQTENHEENTEDVCDTAVLDFLRELQNE